MRGEHDKAPSPLEVDAAAFALLEQLSQREGLAHYRELLAAALPRLREQGQALAMEAWAAMSPTPEPSPEAPADASLSAPSTATAEPTLPLVEGEPS